MSFETIHGHSGVVSLLQKQLQGNSLAHSYIFSGPRGVGKMMTALELAKAEHCLQNIVSGCDECAACRKVASQNHPDIFFIDGSQGAIGIDSIRECQKWLSLKPYEGRKKIVIVDEADKITTQAANSFLKTLEEPPGESLIIICSVNMHSLLPTILSRCQVMKFLPLPLKDVEIIFKERYPGSQKQCKVIAPLSRGCPGLAIHYFENKILEERDIAVDLLTNSVNGNIEYVLKQVKSIGTTRERFINVINLLSLITRDLAVIANNRPSEIINSDITDTLLSLSENVNTEVALLIFQQAEDARLAIEHNMNRQLIVESLFLKVQDNVSRKGRERKKQ